MENLKISTELASAVLEKEVTKCSLVSTARSSINITYFEDRDDFSTVWKEWNIYQFAFKCKEWALSNGHYLKSRGVNILSKESMPKCEVEYIDKNNMFVAKDFYSNTEIEAIIKACTYILNTLSNK